MIIISSALNLIPAVIADLHFPVIGWHNLVTANNVIASSADEKYPASNLARPSTVERWQANAIAEQIITIQCDGSAADYVGIARHNFGSGLVVVSIEGENADTPEQWDVLVEEFMPADDGPIIARFVAGYFRRIRIRLQPHNIIPRNPDGTQSPKR